jgi:hypothetical protein
MRNLITLLFLFSIPLWSQTFLNIQNNNGTFQNSSIASLNKITFNENGDSINYYLQDAGLKTGTTGTTLKLTFEDIPAGDPMPVELVNFSAQLNKNIVTLVWSTATEVDNNGFEIERIGLSPDWNKVGFVEGHGNCNISSFYTFIDKPAGGTKFQYRLKQIDRSGRFTYSKTLSVDIGTPSVFELKQNYPNPFNPSTKIVYNVPIEGEVTLTVYDIMGREVVSLVNENKTEGRYEVTLDGNRLVSGVYFCKMTAGNFTSSIKMLFIK